MNSTLRVFLFSLISTFLLTCSLCLASQEITSKLGRKEAGFGPTQQAAALRQLIEANPGAAQYRITYYTDSDVVVFGCNLEKDIVLRIHSDLDGHGISEEWAGHSLYRIHDAAAGGSLENTPEGRSPGTTEQF
jgi:hypothetical protein